MFSYYEKGKEKKKEKGAFLISLISFPQIFHAKLNKRIFFQIFLF